MAFQRTFAQGEIGPALYGGADQARYSAALATCRNFLVMRGGGVANRPGLQFVAEAKSTDALFVKFVFNPDDTYVIEAGPNYFRFFRSGARVVVGTPDAWADATAYLQGKIVAHGGVNYYALQDHTSNAANDEPGVGTNQADFWYALTDDILEIPTPFTDPSTIVYAQSADVVTLVDGSHTPQELKRFSDRWTLTAVSTAPSIAAPANLNGTAGSAGTLPYSYKVTAVADKTFEESLASAKKDLPCAAPTAAAPNALTWDAVTGAAEYNVYLDPAGNGIYGFIGVASTNAFNDIGYIPDLSLTPPQARVLFAASGDYPRTVGFFQQRRLFGGTANDPETVEASRTGLYKNFSIRSPIQDDDAIEFRIAGKYISEVRHLVEVGQGLVILTSTGEWLAQGDADGVLKPTAINLKQQAYWGAASIIPVVVGNNIVYPQARGQIIRDLAFSFQTQGYEGRDLTLFAPHLFEGKGVTRMDYAQMPNSIVWVVRTDGTLLGLTYLREFDVWGWHRHDSTNGLFRDVCAIPESIVPEPGQQIGTVVEEDAVYVMVDRTINGVDKRYVERFASRLLNDYRTDGFFLDSFATYNGINQDGAKTVTLSSAGGWTTADEITMTASAALFQAGDVGNGLTVWVIAGNSATVARITIEAVDSATVARGHLAMVSDGSAEVPVDLRAVAISTGLKGWSIAVDQLSGLNHLEGETVNVLANGVVITGKVVTGGTITLDQVYDVIRVGLAITAEVETLDLDAADQIIRDRQKKVRSGSLLVERSRGILAGPDGDHLTVYSPEAGTVLETDVFKPAGGTLLTQVVEINFSSTWEKAGRVFIRQTDPLPLSLLGVIPQGIIGN